MKCRYLCFAFVLLLLFGCDSDDAQIIEVAGTIVDVSAEPGFENCGWLVEINGERYAPAYLNAQYEQNGLDVFMSVEFLNQVSDCSTNNNQPQLIRIEQIQPLD